MATVYRAEDRKHHRNAAIKVLSPDLAASVGHDRFLRDIEIAAKRQHQHVLPAYDSGDADGLLYYVMPFVEGEFLKEWLAWPGRTSSRAWGGRRAQSQCTRDSTTATSGYCIPVPTRNRSRSAVRCGSNLVQRTTR